jgi:hypothetical protein
MSYFRNKAVAREQLGITLGSLGGIGLNSLILGQCRLAYASATGILLSRYNGIHLFINGIAEPIPSAGVSLSNGGLSSTTAYYVYAYMNAGTMTLEASATAPTTDSTYGHQVKGGGGGETHSLVGRIITNGSSQFFGGNFSTANGVVSWYNPQRLVRVEQVIIGPVPGAGLDVADNGGTYGFMTATSSNSIAAWQFVGTSRIKYARWRCIMGSTNTGNKARLVHFDDGPANITQIAEVVSNGAGTPVNSAVDVTNTLAALQDGVLDKNIGVQFASVNTTTFTVYKQALELVYDIEAW